VRASAAARSAAAVGIGAVSLRGATVTSRSPRSAASPIARRVAAAGQMRASTAGFTRTVVPATTSSAERVEICRRTMPRGSAALSGSVSTGATLEW
jgi:hypothetical protein